MSDKETISAKNTRITALSAVVTSYKGDTAGRLELATAVGDASMELTRLAGAEGRKGNGK